MYEHKHHDLLPGKHFVRRVARHLSFALSLAALALGLGIAGYHYVGRLPWIDSFLNAAMILGGMGPVDQMDRVEAKVFAGLYALFSGLVFVGIAGIMTAPFAHRLLHAFHIEESKEKRS